jgi:general secretion pathway protein I
VSRAKESGFTLIELMVALAVFALAALTLIKLDSATIRSSEAVSDRLAARISINNLAVEALTDPGPPTLGQAGGVVTNAGRTLRWSRNANRGEAGAALVRMDFVVSSVSGQVLATQTIVKGP